MKAMCALFDMPRASYYAWLKRRPAPDRDAERKALVQTAWEQSHRRYGYRRVTLKLQQQGHPINHKAVLRLMRKLNIRSIARQRNPYRQPKAKRGQHRYPNRLKRDFAAQQPNQKWVTDITYIATTQGWAYLAAIKDLFDGFIVAYHLGRRNSVALVTTLLQQAYAAESNCAGVLLHSDQGFQFSSNRYAILTRQFQWLPSMSRRGNCWDNAPMETFFGHLKAEALHPHPIRSFERTHHHIDDYIQFYNHERIQLKTKQTPAQCRGLSL